MLELFDELEDNRLEEDDLELELVDGVTTTTELADDASEDLLTVELLLKLDTTDELEIVDELDMADEREVLTLETTELLATDAGAELAAVEVTGGEESPEPPPPPPHAVITSTAPIIKPALVANPISHHL